MCERKPRGRAGCGQVGRVGAGLAAGRAASVVLALVLVTVAAPGNAHAQGSSPERPLLTLEEAVAAARAHHPELRRARAEVDAAEARSAQARAPLRPQLRAGAGYQLSVSDSPGVDLLDGVAVERGADLRHSLLFGITASQLLWDFGGTLSSRRAARSLAEAQAESAEASLLDVVLGARLAYFTAGAARALVEVASETLANQQSHHARIQAFVEAELRPAIELAQARADLANARLNLIQAENDYDLARVELNRAMGLGGRFDRAAGASRALHGLDYDVALGAGLAPTAEELADTNTLLDEALGARPEMAVLEHRRLAQEHHLDAARSGRWPRLALASGFTQSGSAFDELGWSWFLGLSLEWRFYQGGLVGAQVRQAQAELAGLEADGDLLVQAIRVEISRARLAIRNGIAAIAAADDVVANARERLRLAEGRYETGAGNALELGDAQLALTNALVQRVHSSFELAAARALLLAALGR
jgi:outer membrane protein